MIEVAFSLLALGLVFALAMTEVRAVFWAAAFAGMSALLFLLSQTGLAFESTAWLRWVGLAFAGLFAALSLPALRQSVVTGPVFGLIRKTMPKISETESVAIDAGTVGWDADLFSGKPNWDNLKKIPAIDLSQEERAFLDGPTEELCEMLDDWQIRHTLRDLPPHIWQFIKDNGFLGMLISKEHGGLGFSAQAQSLVLGKIGSRSPDAVVCVMVPNSLGPGELVEKYGTDAQKERWLAPLAKGKEIPCFGLTGSHSGSDAATMRDIGEICEQEFEGKKTLGIKLNFEKRYITLAPVASVVGLAFKLFDPNNLLGDERDLGITLALIPAPFKGMDIGRRHYPSGMAFPNGPILGKDVFIPIDWVIGGRDGIGQGWKFLMESLSAGRAISLPATGTSAAKGILRVTSAYARIRKQFGLPIGYMEGIEEPLARIVENAYVTEAARAMTAAMVSKGEKPAVISALLKYQATERQRACTRDAMDIHGGRAICDGPGNYLQAGYRMVPVSITVEGANILTRTLMTFGQGAIRCHPYAYAEIKAAQMPRKSDGLAAFDTAFSGHFKFMLSNIFGALFHNITGGLFAAQPENGKYSSYWYRQLARASRTFALVADITVALFGGHIKVKQKISGRLADALSELYLLSAVLKRFEDDGCPEADREIIELCAQNGMHRFQTALGGALDNYPMGVPAFFLKLLAFPLGRRFKPASDKLGQKAARLVLAPGEVRDRLTQDIFISRDPKDYIGILEVAFEKTVETEELQRKMRKAIKAGTIGRYHDRDWFAEAVAKQVLTPEEAETLRDLEDLVERAIKVDDFAAEELSGKDAATSGMGKQLAAE